MSDAISPARHPQKSSQHVRACAAGDGAICSKNRIIVPYHGDNPNTRNGARLRSPSPIMAPGLQEYRLLSIFKKRSTITAQTIQRWLCYCVTTRDVHLQHATGVDYIFLLAFSELFPYANN